MSLIKKFFRVPKKSTTEEVPVAEDIRIGRPFNVQQAVHVEFDGGDFKGLPTQWKVLLDQGGIRY